MPPAVDGSGPVPSSDRPETASEEAPERKEKSVLQAKLTKLAIQIGYAGKFFFISINVKRLPVFSQSFLLGDRKRYASLNKRHFFPAYPFDQKKKNCPKSD